jgi:hypothetical protein
MIGCNVGMTDGIMKCTVETGSGVIRVIYIPSFIKTGIGVEAIKVFPQQFERLQCWYY